MKMIALATAVAGVGYSAAADIQLTIDPTGSSTATITGSGMLDENLFDVIIIRLFDPIPLPVRARRGHSSLVSFSLLHEGS